MSQSIRDKLYAVQDRLRNAQRDWQGEAARRDAINVLIEAVIDLSRDVEFLEGDVNGW